MLGRVGVAAHQQESPVAELGLGVPDLLAVNHELVAVTFCSCGQAGQIAARSRLAEQLAEGELARQQAGQEPALLVFGAVAQQGGAQHGDGGTDESGCLLAAGRYLREDPGLPRLAPAPAVGAGPGQSGPAVLEQLALPGPSAVEVLSGALGVRIERNAPPVVDGSGSGMAVVPGPNPGPERGLLGGFAPVAAGVSIGVSGDQGDPLLPGARAMTVTLCGRVRDAQRTLRGRVRDAQRTLCGRVRDAQRTLRGRVRDAQRTLCGRVRFHSVWTVEGTYDYLGRTADHVEDGLWGCLAAPGA